MKMEGAAARNPNKTAPEVKPAAKAATPAPAPVVAPAPQAKAQPDRAPAGPGPVPAKEKPAAQKAAAAPPASAASKKAGGSRQSLARRLGHPLVCGALRVRAGLSTCHRVPHLVFGEWWRVELDWELSG